MKKQVIKSLALLTILSFQINFFHEINHEVIAQEQITSLSYEGTITFGSRNLDIGEIAFDKDNNLYILGGYQDSLYFQPEIDLNIDPQNDYEFFVAKIDEKGESKWICYIKGSANPSEIIVGQDGNVYITGYFFHAVNGQANFLVNEAGDTLSVDNTLSSGISDIFVTKISASGEFNLTKTFRGKGSNDLAIMEITSLNELIIAGHFNNGIDLSPFGCNNHDGNGSFLIKMDKDFNCKWDEVFRIGSEWNDVEHRGRGSEIKDIVIDENQDDIYIAGNYRISEEFATSVFVSKIDSDGDSEWNKTFECENSSCYVEKLVLDKDDNIWIGGTFKGNSYLSTKEKENFQESRGDTDIFILKMDMDLDVQSTWILGGEDQDIFYSLLIDSESIFLTSVLSDNVLFKKDDQEYNLETSYNTQNIFLIQTDIYNQGLWVNPIGYKDIDDPLNTINVDMIVDNNENLVLYGEFDKPSDFDPISSEDIRQPMGYSDFFITLYIDDPSSMSPIRNLLDREKTVTFSGVLTRHPNPRYTHKLEGQNVNLIMSDYYNQYIGTTVIIKVKFMDDKSGRFLVVSLRPYDNGSNE